MELAPEMSPLLLIKPDPFALHPICHWSWNFKLGLSSDPLRPFLPLLQETEVAVVILV